MSRKDPLPAFCFEVRLSIDGMGDGKAYFKSVGGLKAETEVVDYRSGGVNHSTYKLVGATKWPNIVLKRGFTGDNKLMEWRDAWLQPDKKKTRATITITQLDTQMQAKYEWQFADAWPCKWELSELDASKNEIAIETVELAHHGMISCGPK